MRINKFLAQATGMSRREADRIIEERRVEINGQLASPGNEVGEQDNVLLDNKPIEAASDTHVTTIMLNKPVGYVCSRNGQGSRTVYDLLPPELHQLKPVGRLDKYSSGLLLLTSDGQLAHELTHPSFQKTKVYEARLDRALQPLHRQMIAEMGVQLEDGPSRFSLERMHEGNDKSWRIVMSEGRNRQIRRTFDSLGYSVIKLHRTNFGNYKLAQVPTGKYTELTNPTLK